MKDLEKFSKYLRRTVSASGLNKSFMQSNEASLIHIVYRYRIQEDEEKISKMKEALKLKLITAHVVAYLNYQKSFFSLNRSFE